MRRVANATRLFFFDYRLLTTDYRLSIIDFTMKWFAERGMKPTVSQANFMFVNIGTPARAFRDACRAKGVIVARDFPPFEKTHARISLGTMEEMTKAVQVFGEVLAKKSTAAA